MRKKISTWIIAMFFMILIPPIASALVNDSIYSYYSFDVNQNDEVGARNWVLQGTPTQTAGCKVGGCYDFDKAGGDYMNGAVFSDFDTIGAGLTITYWMKPDTSGTAENSMAFYDNNQLQFNKAVDDTLTVYFKDAGATWRNLDPSYTIPAGTWTFVALTWNRTGDTVTRVWLNMSNTDNDASADINNAGGSDNVANVNGGPDIMDGMIDEIAIWNRTLTYDELVLVYNGGSGCNVINGSCDTPPAPTNQTDIDFTITDQWNSSSILSFNINVTWSNGSSTQHSTTNGTVSLNDVGNITSVNVTYWNMTDYFDATLLNEAITINSSNTVTTTTYQAVLCLNASSKVSGAYITADNFTIESTSQTCFNITAGSHNAMAQRLGWYSKNQTFSVVALSNTTQTIQNMSYANLTIYAIDGTTNESLSNYNLNLNSISYPAFGESASGVTNHSFYLINGTYNVTIQAPGYAVTTSLANITVSGHTNYTFTLYKSNSVTITIRDEITNDLITENITIRWSNNSTTWENTTDTGTLFIHNITATNYTLLFYGSNYSTRTYTITVGPNSTQFLTAYMISSTYSTIFTMKDIDTGQILDGVSITMYKLINSSWVTVESKVSDISGKAQFYYDPIANYRFYLSKSGYEDYVFYLNPILFSNYDVFLTKTAVLNYSVDYDDVSIIWSPNSFDNNENTSFNFLISSPDGQLTDYSITLVYPGGSSTASGVNAIGEQLSAWVNITNATRWDRVTFYYNYTGTVSGLRTFTQYLSINTNITGSENTWITNKDRTFGLGIFERMLIVTIIIIFTVGIATMVGQPLPGLAIGLFLYGFMVFTGFIPLWSILPSMLIGVLFLVWKSGGY